MSVQRCPHCGTANRVGANFCNGCGTDLRESAPPPVAPTPFPPASPSPDAAPTVTPMTDSGMSLDDEVDDGQLQFDFAVDTGDDAADASTLMDEVEQFLREQGDTN